MLLKVAVSIFLILHGIVHVLYVGQSWRVFELQPGLAWPDNSWAFSHVLGTPASRMLGVLACGVAAVGFIVAGIALLASQAWWEPLVIATAIFSSIAYLLLWNGKLQRLDDQGVIGIIINLAIVGLLVLAQWPQFQF